MKRAFFFSAILGIVLVVCGVQAQYVPPPTYPTYGEYPMSSPLLTDPRNPPSALSFAVKSESTTDKDRPAWDLSDPEIKAAHKAWTLAFMNREAEKFAEHKRAFTDTGTMSVVVFWAAHLLLTWSIVAASIEFVRAQRVRKVATEIQELRVSLEGVALKTSLHGTLLLVIAMLFYYLFLKFVYPITIVGG